MKSLLAFLLLSLPATLSAAMLPGFRAERLATAAGFVTSVAVDSHGVVYYTLKTGEIVRLEDGQSRTVATVVTDQEVGNHGLIGIALQNDTTAVVHYTEPGPTYEIISRIDLVSGEETILARLACDVEMPGRKVSSEHHGGNPTVARDGSIFVGIGEFGGGVIASRPEWNGGKIFRITPDGTIEQFARGLRNPFDLLWDDEKQRLIVADNGPDRGDEINILTTSGENLGWPFTFGHMEPIAGAHVPDFVFPVTVAPTGMQWLRPDANPFLRRGMLLGAFVTGAIYYFPDLDPVPLPEPIALVENGDPVIDVTQGVDGRLYFATPTEIWTLTVPRAGDCNGDGRTDADDFHSLKLELVDGDPELTIDAQKGSYRGSWGCDANGDSLINALDVESLLAIVPVRRRAAGR